MHVKASSRRTLGRHYTFYNDPDIVLVKLSESRGEDCIAISRVAFYFDKKRLLSGIEIIGDEKSWDIMEDITAPTSFVEGKVLIESKGENEAGWEEEQDQINEETRVFTTPDHDVLLIEIRDRNSEKVLQPQQYAMIAKDAYVGIDEQNRLAALWLFNIPLYKKELTDSSSKVATPPELRDPAFAKKQQELIELLRSRIPEYSIADDMLDASYLVFGEFAMFIMKEVEKNPESSVVLRSFQLLDEMASSKDDDVVNLALVGALEMFTGTAENAEIARTHLKNPESLKNFEELIEQWKKVDEWVKNK